MKDAEIIGAVIGYDIEKYQNDDIEVYIMRNSNNEEDVKGMGGKVCAIQLLSSKYATPRGLRVGGPPYCACMLYSRDSLSYTFSYSIEDGTVASISFYTNYFIIYRMTETGRDAVWIVSWPRFILGGVQANFTPIGATGLFSPTIKRPSPSLEIN